MSEIIRRASDIPEYIDKNELASGISSVFSDLVKSGGYTPSQLSSLFNISESSVSKIRTDWSGKETSFKSNNTVLTKIVCYYLDNRDNLNDKVVASLGSLNPLRELEAYVHNQGKDDQYQRLVTFGYITVYKMLGVEATGFQSVSKTFNGKFLLVRNASIKNRFVTSAIEIRQRGNDRIWEYFHTKVDGIGRVIRSDGIVIPIGQNLYLISDIENGRGIESLTIRIPDIETPSILEGFISTLDGYGNPFVTKCALITEATALSHVKDDVKEGFVKFLTSDTYYRPDKRLVGTWDRKNLNSKLGDISENISNVCCGKGVVSCQTLGEVN